MFNRDFFVKKILLQYFLLRNLPPNLEELSPKISNLNLNL